MGRGNPKRTRKGAAPKRRGVATPGSAHAAGAAPEHSKRGRPKLRAAPPIAAEGSPELAARLSTTAGRRTYLAGLADWGMKNPLGYAEVGRLEALRKLCGEFRDEVSSEELPSRIADLEAQVAQLLEAVAGKKGSALRADAAVEPPTLNEVEDPIRADMAPPATLPRGGEPYRS